METWSPDYSSYAGKYAKSRPGYPEELFAYLATLPENHELVWDCATGNGQAALELTKYFKKVIATDISSEQIKHSIKHNQIEYKVCKAEKSLLESESADLITVASAVHWFDLDAFFNEVRRIIRPGGILAVWTYHIGIVEPPFDRLFSRFYQEVISPYFTKGAKLVDEKYSGIKLPGEEIAAQNFFMSADWNLDNMFSFIESWSGTQMYIEVNRKSPIDFIADDLKQIWGNPEKIRTIRWPLFIRISRL